MLTDPNTNTKTNPNTNPNTNTNTNTNPNPNPKVRFLFDNAPLCAVYNGELSGPDSVYATVKHYGLVAQSWRENVTAQQNGL